MSLAGFQWVCAAKTRSELSNSPQLPKDSSSDRLVVGISPQCLLQKQQILGAKGLCLSAMAGDSVESQHGTFAYRPVPAGTTCQSLTGKPWPVKAQVPPPAKPAP